jgi:hypothetical protein
MEQLEAILQLYEQQKQGDHSNSASVGVTSSLAQIEEDDLLN